jgi:tagatose-1,6-bisphosphate aldolase non-catalytic subunit AgaZ/GatZ
MANLHRPIPCALLAQYLRDLFPDPPEGDRTIDPQKVLEYRIRTALAPYVAAVRT